MRWRIRRRSVSSLVSPGPRVPMPPPSRDSAALEPTSRGSRYFSCASSTCSLPSRVRARRAKMSRMSWVRSTTLRPSASSRLRSCAGLSSLSKMTTSTSSSSHDGGERLDLAAAEERRRIRPRPLLQHAENDRPRRRRRRGRPARRASVRDRPGARIARLKRPTSAARSAHRTCVERANPPRAARGRRRAHHSSDSSTRSHGDRARRARAVGPVAVDLDYRRRRSTWHRAGVEQQHRSPVERIARRRRRVTAAAHPIGSRSSR